MTTNAELKAAIETEYRNSCKLDAYRQSGIDWRAGEATAAQNAALAPLMNACSTATVQSMTMRGPLEKGLRERKQDRAVAAVIQSTGSSASTTTHYYRTVGNRTPYIIAPITETAYDATFD